MSPSIIPYLLLLLWSNNQRVFFHIFAEELNGQGRERCCAGLGRHRRWPERRGWPGAGRERDEGAELEERKNGVVRSTGRTERGHLIQLLT